MTLCIPEGEQEKIRNLNHEFLVIIKVTLNIKLS